jgi:ketosteroid isomerase-like protein
MGRERRQERTSRSASQEGLMPRATNERSTDAPDAAAGVMATHGLRPADRPGSGRRRLAATVARWPLEVDDGFESAWHADPSLVLVRQSIADYRSGRADRAAQSWHDEIVWRVMGDGPMTGEWAGAEKVFEYHRLLGLMTDGAFRQRLIALEGSRGLIVDGYLRTTANRDGRTLDIPTLAVFELTAGRIRRVTEIPGDRQAWRQFWAD